MRQPNEKQHRYLTARRQGLTVAQAAERIGVSKHTAYNWRKSSWFRKTDDAAAAEGPIEEPDGSPVDIVTFATSPEYLALDDTWPSNLALLKRVYEGECWCLVLADAIGAGKTRTSCIVAAYELYLLSTFTERPSTYFDLGRTGTLVFGFASRTTGQARDVGFATFRTLIEGSPYFRTKYPPKTRRDRLIFPNSVEARSLSAHPYAALGQDVYVGVVDEGNFGARTEHSVRAADGGEFVQAAEQVQSMRPRMVSRFFRGGRQWGKLIVASSPRSTDDFTEQLIAEADRDRGILVSRRALWEVKAQFDVDRTFPVFVGDRSRPPRILMPDESVPIDDRHLVMHVPSDLRRVFERDVRRGLMDLAAIPVQSAGAFFTDRTTLDRAFCRRSIINKESITSGEGLMLYPRRIEHPEKARFAHVDLSKTRDSTGLAVGHVAEWETVQQGDARELRPRIVIDLALEVRPPRHGEIDTAQIRRFLYSFRRHLRLDHVGADQFGWALLQELSRHHFRTSLVSVDREPQPYEFLKQMIGDGAIELPEHERLHDELLYLEAGRDKIDHRKGRSKDVADAVAGVCWALSRSRILQAEAGVLAAVSGLQCRTTALGPSSPNDPWAAVNPLDFSAWTH